MAGNYRSRKTKPFLCQKERDVVLGFRDPYKVS